MASSWRQPPKITNEDIQSLDPAGRQRNGTRKQNDRGLRLPTVQSGHMARLIDTVAAVHRQPMARSKIQGVVRCGLLATRGTSMSDAKADVKNLEDRRFQAMIDGDFDALDKLLGDGLIYTHSTGQSDTRAEYIAQCKNGKFKYTKIERPVENIQVYGDTVVVTGHTKMDVIADGKPKVLNSRYTDVWIRSPKGWQMVVWQSTPIRAPAA